MHTMIRERPKTSQKKVTQVQERTQVATRETTQVREPSQKEKLNALEYLQKITGHTSFSDVFFATCKLLFTLRRGGYPEDYYEAFIRVHLQNDEEQALAFIKKVLAGRYKSIDRKRYPDLPPIAFLCRVLQRVDGGTEMASPFEDDSIEVDVDAVLRDFSQRFESVRHYLASLNSSEGEQVTLAHADTPPKKNNNNDKE